MTTEHTGWDRPRAILKQNIYGLRDLTVADLGQPRFSITDEEFDHIFRQCEALWLHSGDPAQPHAELTSGKCSNGFVNVLAVLRYTNLCAILASELVWKARQESERFDNDSVSWVVGSDHAGATLSYEIARDLSAQHDFTEKGPDKSQTWKRFVIAPDEDILQVEELITTTGTLQAVRDGIRVGNPHPVEFFPLVLTLVHRSDVYEFDGSPIVFLRHYDIKTWDPTECPLCAQGSRRLRPKSNWAELTGKSV